MDSKRRSIAKTCSWRFIATVVTTLVAYFTATLAKGSLGAGEMAMTIGLLDTTIKFGIYFFHERAWNKIDYGRAKLPKAGDFDI
jgi:uncharacterized membrane protein